MSDVQDSPTTNMEAGLVPGAYHGRPDVRYILSEAKQTYSHVDRINVYAAGAAFCKPLCWIN